jgi:phage shock protein PspC (stress-responsive transcriptional regulator)
MVSEAAVARRVQRARLRRRTEHRLLAGVAGGIADRLNAPVAFVRFLIVLASAWAPWTLAAYAGAALLIPARDRTRPDWDNLVGACRFGLVFAGPWLAGPSLSIDEPMGGSTGWWIASWGLLAVGAAVMLSADYVRGRGRTRAEARATVLAGLPVAGCALVLAAGAVLVPGVRWEHAVPLAAIAGGVALVIGGRREYVAPALLALAAAVVVVASGARLDGGVGDMRVVPRDPSGAPIVVRRAVGDVDIDLGSLRRNAGRVEIEATVGIGDLVVRLPPGTQVVLDARVGRGSIDAWSLSRDSEIQGFDRRLFAVDRIVGGRPRRASVRIAADVGLGTVRISQDLG